jgi:hypothetical protein
MARGLTGLVSVLVLVALGMVAGAFLMKVHQKPMVVEAPPVRPPSSVSLAEPVKCDLCGRVGAPGVSITHDGTMVRHVCRKCYIYMWDANLALARQILKNKAAAAGALPQNPKGLGVSEKQPPPVVSEEKKKEVSVDNAGGVE